MNDQRPTRWPCSADSSRNAGPSPRSFRNAETGVSQSSMNVSETGTTFGSATAAKEHLLGVAERQPAALEQHGEVVEHVGGLLGHALVGLLARRPRDLLGLLADLLADAVPAAERAGAQRPAGGRAVRAGRPAPEPGLLPPAPAARRRARVDAAQR